MRRKKWLVVELLCTIDLAVLWCTAPDKVLFVRSKGTRAAVWPCRQERLVRLDGRDV